MRILQIPQKLVYEKFYVPKKIYGLEIAAVNLSKNLLPEKRKENV